MTVQDYFIFICLLWTCVHWKTLSFFICNTFHTQFINETNALEKTAEKEEIGTEILQQTISILLKNELKTISEIL